MGIVRLASVLLPLSLTTYSVLSLWQLSSLPDELPMTLLLHCCHWCCQLRPLLLLPWQLLSLPSRLMMALPSLLLPTPCPCLPLLLLHCRHHCCQRPPGFRSSWQLSSLPCRLPTTLPATTSLILPVIKMLSLLLLMTYSVVVVVAIVVLVWHAANKVTDYHHCPRCLAGSLI